MSAIIFLSLGLGFLIGYRQLLNEKLLKSNSKIQTVFVLLMIFFMGLKIGADSEILGNLGSIGGKAFLYAAFCIAGSVLCVYIVSRLFLKGDQP